MSVLLRLSATKEAPNSLLYPPEYGRRTTPFTAPIGLLGKGAPTINRFQQQLT